MIPRFSLRSSVALIAVAAVAAVTVGVVAAHRNSDATGPVSAVGLRAGGRATPTAEASSSWPLLPTGSHQVDGIPTGFPHDDLGAVATAVAATRAQTGFDYDQAAIVATVYADPAERVAFEDLARAAVAARREQAGVGVTEEPPAPASYAATPLAYNVTEFASDQYAVHVLSWVTLTSTTNEVKDHLYVGTQLVQWHDDDWVLTLPTPGSRRRLRQEQPPAATPSTDAFTRAGWVLIEEVNR